METYYSHGHFTRFVFFWQQHPQPTVLSAPTMNLMLTLCVIGSLITVFPPLFFSFSHPICENLSPGALLYQAPAAAVILDMAGSRYRKTARACSTEKNLEIPLIYPRLWLQSKPVAGGKAQEDNSVWALCASKKSFRPPPQWGTGEMLGAAMHTREHLAQQSWGGHLGTTTAANLLPAPSLASWENPLSTPWRCAIRKAHPLFTLSLLCSDMRLEQMGLPTRQVGSHQCL